jgi:hypothetical protein
MHLVADASVSGSVRQKFYVFAEKASFEFEAQTVSGWDMWSDCLVLGGIAVDSRPPTSNKLLGKG